MDQSPVRESLRGPRHPCRRTERTLGHRALGGTDDRNAPRSVACDVRALAEVAVVAGDVAAAVVHTANGLDAEVGVAPGRIAGQPRRAALDVEAILSRADGDVAL